MQYQEGELRGVSFGSRTLTPADKKYHSSKLELLVVKWVICNLLEFICIMPNTFIFTKKKNSITYIMRTGKPAVTVQRWVNELAEFSLFFLHYNPHKQNIIADTLNCKPQKSNLKHKKLCTEAHSV